MTQLCVYCGELVEMEVNHVYTNNRWAHLKCYADDLLRIANAEKPKVMGIRLPKETRKKKTALDIQRDNLDALLSVLNRQE